ncbi:MAG: 50S ribosomal protein L11 methyltransferase [Bacteroidaceae bacterium]|nr:50S ribosomal protein L11 methyltransferase [Bacteroidaceae bacterium]
MTGQYIETTLTITPYSEDAADVMAALLANGNYETFIPSENGVKCYILKENYSEDIVAEAVAQNPFDCTITYSSIEVENEDWNKTWVEESFTPIYIGNECVIHSPKDILQITPKYDILINPIMAFGSGHHQTTSMMTQWILEEDIAGKDVLDMGCGTAILAIASTKCGAKNVCAIDIDERAYNNAIDNAALNQCTNMDIRLGGAEAIGNSTFDIILANINKNILISDMEIYAKAMNKGGLLFISGFYSSDIEDITSEALKHNFKLIKQKEKDDWVSLKLQKQ